MCTQIKAIVTFLIGMAIWRIGADQLEIKYANESNKFAILFMLLVS